MGLMRRTLTCVFLGCLLYQFCAGCRFGREEARAKVVQDEVTEGRGRHRLQLLFPLLLRISSRLATLVPTAMMALLGVIVFVVFSKKALIVSLLALFLTISGKINSKNDDVYVIKSDSYPEYNNEEHIYYHPQGPPKYREVYYPPYGGAPPHCAHHVHPGAPWYRRVMKLIDAEEENTEDWNSIGRQKSGHD